MNQCVLDKFLVEALQEMTMANWAGSQKLLASRLEQADEIGHKRLNLFLLSVAAASGGYQDVANQLWSQAQQAPLTEPTLRYIDIQLPPNDPRQSVLLDLEKAWWDFNGWNQPGASSKAGAPSTDEVHIDWEFVVDATLQGNDAEVEARYGRLFDNHPAEGAFLWNLLALAYLQAGDVRTYDDMVGNRPPLPPPDTVPENLDTALTARGLGQALEVLKRGEWLTNVALFEAPSAPPVEEQLPELTENEWRIQMREGFFEVFEGRFLEAARKFQKVNSATGDRRRLMMGLNALALAYFKQGDYTQCERVYQEFQNLLEAFPLDPKSVLAKEYLTWLQNVDAAPPDGRVFFSPFDTSSDWNDPVSPQSSQVDFWEQFDSTLSLLGEGDHLKAQMILQKIEVNAGGSLDPFQRYLLTLLFLAGSVMAGDYSEVQELSDEVNRLEPTVVFPPDRTEEVADSLRWAGFEKLAQRVMGGPETRALPLNPWEDVTVRT